MATKAEETVAATEAAHGQKMIELKVRFWTNDLAGEPGKIVPKHAWAAGIVRVENNEAHGIKPGSPTPFNSLPELAGVVEHVLIAHGIKLHPSTKERKYRHPLATPPKVAKTRANQIIKVGPTPYAKDNWTGYMIQVARRNTTTDAAKADHAKSAVKAGYPPTKPLDFGWMADKGYIVFA